MYHHHQCHAHPPPSSRRYRECMASTTASRMGSSRENTSGQMALSPTSTPSMLNCGAMAHETKERRANEGRMPPAEDTQQISGSRTA